MQAVADASQSWRKFVDAGRNPGGPGEVKLWDVAAGKELASLDSKDQFTCLAFSRDGRRLAAGNLDGSIKLWDIPRVLRGEKK